MAFSLNLVPGGIEVRDWVDGAETVEIARPTKVYELLRYWHWRLDGIDEHYTLGDLFALLRDVEGIELLSPMLACDVAAYMDESRKDPTAPATDIEYLRVYNRADLDRYVADPDRPDDLRGGLFGDDDDELSDEEAAEEDARRAGVAELTGEPKTLAIVDATGDDPVTGKPRLRRLRAPEMHGKWVPPYHLYHDFSGWGKWEEPYPGYFEKEGGDPANFKGNIAVSYTPIADLMHLPLGYDPKIEFRDDYAGGNVVLATEVTIRFGEFVHAVLWDLGFHGTPAARDAFVGDLRERKAEIDELLDREEAATDDKEE
jgi:hypothetical protein